MPEQPNTPISLKLYNGTTWNDYTSYIIGAEVNETGISRISNAAINLEAKKSDLTALITQPYQQIKLEFYANYNWHKAFYGYINSLRWQYTPGAIDPRIKVSLDCLNFSGLLDEDYITYDFWANQSPNMPLTNTDNLLTFRDMLEAILNIPDSRKIGDTLDPLLSGTGFVLTAEPDVNGIDAPIDSTCVWQTHTIFDVVRTVCDRIGYDGYYYRADEMSPPEIVIGKFDRPISAVFNGGYLGVVEEIFEGLDTVKNRIYIHGGHDAGVPADGDRFTEYAVSKYNPPIWLVSYNGIREGVNVTTSLEDAVASIFSDQNLAVGDTCVKAAFVLSGCSSGDFYLTLDLSKTEAQKIDALNRITGLTFSLKTATATPVHEHRLGIYFILTDASGNKLYYFYDNGVKPFPLNGEHMVSLDLTQTPKYSTIFMGLYRNQWCYEYGSSPTAFDKSQIVGFTVQIGFVDTQDFNNAEHTISIFVDGLQFNGGYKIDPFESYSATYNPPVSDYNSMTNYGLHVLHYMNNNITSFEYAQAEGQRLLNNLKQPASTYKFTVIPTSVLYPGQVVSVDSVLRRIKEVNYKWSNKDKILYAAYTTIPKLAPLPPIWTESNFLKYFAK